MYHIRRADNHDERSLHIESTDGLLRATQEAMLRAEYTGVAYQIVDDNGNIICEVDCFSADNDVQREIEAELSLLKDHPAIKPWSFSRSFFIWSAVIVAMILFRVIFGKEIS